MPPPRSPASVARSWSQPANLTHAPGQPRRCIARFASLLSTGHWRVKDQRRDGHLPAGDFPVVHDNSGQINAHGRVFSDITGAAREPRTPRAPGLLRCAHRASQPVLLLDRMQHAIAAADRNGDMLAVCYLDLDGFKPVNDTWGHAMGDSLLGLVATRLQKLVRASDTVSRAWAATNS